MSTVAADTPLRRPGLRPLQDVGTEIPRAAALARADGVEGSPLQARLDDAFAVVAGHLFRREVRVRARACLGGMLSGLERKTSWSLAEHAGETAPDGMQRLFTTAHWDADLVRDDLRGHMAGVLGDPDGVLIGTIPGWSSSPRSSAAGSCAPGRPAASSMRSGPCWSPTRRCARRSRTPPSPFPAPTPTAPASPSP